jgi:hypothetical protein
MPTKTVRRYSTAIRPDTAAVRWYRVGFALGAGGAKPTMRRGRPRLDAMAKHWRRGISDGAFARDMFVGAYAAPAGGASNGS